MGEKAAFVTETFLIVQFVFQNVQYFKIISKKERYFRLNS